MGVDDGGGGGVPVPLLALSDRLMSESSDTYKNCCSSLCTNELVIIEYCSFLIQGLGSLLTPRISILLGNNKIL